MFFLSLTVNQYVIEEYQNKFLQVTAKSVIHKSLEGGGSIAQAEKHDQEFKVVMVSSKGCFLNIIGVHAYLMIS
jgi:stress-induced morphogen